MKLTRRQEEFVHNLLDLYRELQGPFHYTLLAERLGVSRFTAYDMLRLLEEKGLVTSTYQLAEGKSGPGRSEVFYKPTDKARRLMAELAGEIESQDWAIVKARVLKKVQAGELQDRELAEQMLARVPPDEPKAIRYCVEVMTIVALRLRERSGRRLLLNNLSQILPASETTCRPNLSLLGGFALGVLAEESGEDYEWERELLDHVRRYQEIVIDMEPALSSRLAANLRRVFAPLLRS